MIIIKSQGEHVWISVRNVAKDFDVPIGAVVKSVDGLGMLLNDDEGQVFSANSSFRN